RARVPQNDTAPVMPTARAETPPRVGGTGSDSIAPRSPTERQAQRNSPAPRRRRNGAAQVSMRLMESMPRTMKKTLTSQNTPNAISWPLEIPNHAGKGWGSSKATSEVHRTKIAEPPIQVWMPNQPHATMALMSAGTLEPNTPNDDRRTTGNGMP